jgi:hypothetical protein
MHHALMWAAAALGVMRGVSTILRNRRAVSEARVKEWHPGDEPLDLVNDEDLQELEEWFDQDVKMNGHRK